MRGFAKIVFLLLIIFFISIVGYVMYQDYQQFQSTKLVRNSLDPIDSSYKQLRSYVPVTSTASPPIVSIDSTSQNSYVSPFSPCVSLIDDRNWQIYASSRNIFPNDEQMMLYDRFWNVVWLGLKPEGSETMNFKFYGPFRFEDVSDRSFVEYLLLGRDVTQRGGKFEVSLSSGCNQN